MSAGDSMKISNEQHKSFHDYIYSFYNDTDGIYPIKNITHSMIDIAIEKYIKDYSNKWGGGDSLDRESVRDIILEDNNNTTWNCRVSWGAAI